MPPADLPRVAIVGVPARLSLGGTAAARRAYWEWLRVELAAGGTIAVFDPDHLCAPGWFGRPCRLAIELFRPTVGLDAGGRAGLVPGATDADPTAPPTACGRVTGEHRQEWRYTGPVTAYEERDGARRRVVRHVLDAPQTTLRLVLDIGDGTILAQLRDPADAPPPGTAVVLRDGRAELVGVALIEGAERSRLEVPGSGL